MDLIKFVPEQLLIEVAALYVIGLFLKNIDKIPDNIIPLVLLVVGVLFSVGLLGFSFTAILQGVICAGVSVFSNQLIKQLNKEE